MATSEVQPSGAPRIFIIGFNRCGTRSLDGFFKGNGFRTLHWQGGRLAKSIYARFWAWANRAKPAENPLLLGPEYDRVQVFSDMESVRSSTHDLHAYKLFKEFDAQYPGSKFILNLRDKQGWLASRAAHNGGRYLAKYKKIYGVARKQQVLQRWAAEWDAHLAAVRAHFRTRAGKDFLEFHIEHDDANKLVEFLRADHPRITARHYKHVGKSGASKRAATFGPDGGAGVAAVVAAPRPPSRPRVHKRKPAAVAMTTSRQTKPAPTSRLTRSTAPQKKAQAWTTAAAATKPLLPWTIHQQPKARTLTVPKHVRTLQPPLHSRPNDGFTRCAAC